MVSNKRHSVAKLQNGVSTVGLDEETIREYVRSQEEADKKLDQLGMFE